MVTLKALGGKTVQLPVLLDRVLDEVGVGAMLRNTRTDRLVMIVDFRGFSPTIVVIGQKGEPWQGDWAEENYELFALDDYHQWLVLTPGQDDFVFGED